MLNAFKLHAATVIKNNNNNAINTVLKTRPEIKPLRPLSHGLID